MVKIMSVPLIVHYIPFFSMVFCPITTTVTQTK